MKHKLMGKVLAVDPYTLGGGVVISALPRILIFLKIFKKNIEDFQKIFEDFQKKLPDVSKILFEDFQKKIPQIPRTGTVMGHWSAVLFTDALVGS